MLDAWCRVMRRRPGDRAAMPAAVGRGGMCDGAARTARCGRTQPSVGRARRRRSSASVCAVVVDRGDRLEPSPGLVAPAGGRAARRRRRTRAAASTAAAGRCRARRPAAPTTAASCSPRSRRAPDTTMPSSISRRGVELAPRRGSRASASARSGRPRPRSQSAIIGRCARVAGDPADGAQLGQGGRRSRRRRRR